jgi:hypothetical protein
MNRIVYSVLMIVSISMIFIIDMDKYGGIWFGANIVASFIIFLIESRGNIDMRFRRIDD